MYQRQIYVHYPRPRTFAVPYFPESKHGQHHDLKNFWVPWRWSSLVIASVSEALNEPCDTTPWRRCLARCFCFYRWWIAVFRSVGVDLGWFLGYRIRALSPRHIVHEALGRANKIFVDCGLFFLRSGSHTVIGFEVWLGNHSIAFYSSNTSLLWNHLPYML